MKKWQKEAPRSLPKNSSRIKTAKNLLYQLIGYEWGSKKCKATISTYNEIYALLDLIAVHYKTLLKNK